MIGDTTKALICKEFFLFLKVIGDLKTVIIMANTKLVFLSLIDENIELEVFRSESEIVIDIKDVGCEHQYNYQQVVLDVPTAIQAIQDYKNFN